MKYEQNRIDKKIGIAKRKAHEEAEKQGMPDLWLAATLARLKAVKLKRSTTSQKPASPEVRC